MDEIFISYSRKDEAFARKLATWLHKTLNVGIWIDIEDITPGIKWSSAIQEGLDSCKVMIVIVTPDSMESINVEDEWQYFLDQDKPVVPILLKSAPIPYQLRRIQYIDFSVQEEYPNALRQLMGQVRSYLNPLPGEQAILDSRTNIGRRTTGHIPETKSRRDTEGVTRKKAKKGGVMPIFIIGLLVGIIVMMAAAMAFLLLAPEEAGIRIASLRGGSRTAQIIFPDSSEVRRISDVDTIPAGSQIITNDETIEIFSEENQQSAIVQANSDVIVGNFTDQVDLGLVAGTLSLNTGTLTNGQIQTPYGIDIALAGQSLDVAINPESDTVRADCYVGNCTISDDTGRSRDVEGGESLTFSGTEHDFDTAEITRIPGPILFASYRHGRPEIYVMNTDGSNATRLTTNEVLDLMPGWSPDGQRIVFVSTQSGNYDIYTMNNSGGDIVRLTNNSARDSLPVWSRDGTRIAFVSNRDGNDEIYVMNADGSDVTRLTDNRWTDTDPAWSPDSTRIVFSSNRDGNDEIYIMNADGTEAVNISNNPASDTMPAWSPDAARLAFSSNREINQYDIFVMNVDGSDVTRLTTHSANDTEPAWSPDNTRLVFMSQRAGNNKIYALTVSIPDSAVNLTDLSQTAAEQEPAWVPLIRAGA